MANTRLDSVRETLEQELELAENEVGRLKEELKAAEADRKAIADALTALGKRKAKKLSDQKPAPKKQQVMAIVASLLDQNGEMPREDLEALVKERLTADGTTHNGFGLRFKEAMRAPSFSHDAQGNVSLAGGKVGTG